MLDSKKILVPVDFSERSTAVARYATALAKQFQSELLLLHVEHKPSVFASVAAHTHHSGAAAVMELTNAKARLEMLAAAQFRGVAVSQRVMEGDPAEAIVECARAIDAGLIMMPTRGCGTYRRTVVGSVTAKVLHDCDCPVWTSVHIENALPTDPFCRRITCAIDLGPHTDKVLNWASCMASKVGGRLLVVHAPAMLDPLIEEAADPDPNAVEMKTARENIDRMLRRSNIVAEVVVESGAVPEIVYRKTAEFASDLLVIGRHMQNGIAGRLHPHAYRIISESPCPVVSV